MWVIFNFVDYIPNNLKFNISGIGRGSARGRPIPLTDEPEESLPTLKATGSVIVST